MAVEHSKENHSGYQRTLIHFPQTQKQQEEGFNSFKVYQDFHLR
jgi:hypothetical protein